MEQSKFLTIRILLQLLEHEKEKAGVTFIANALGEEKYTVSRAMTQMEKEGLINKKTSRAPELTKIGKRMALQYADRIDVIQKHLQYEGLSGDTAEKDAFYWAVYSSDETVEMIRNLAERYHIRYEFRNHSRFNGAELCRKLKDGTYRFPFLIYREQVKNGNNISMANEGFDHPCTLQVKDGQGRITLHSQEMRAHSGLTNNLMKGSVSSLKYFDTGEFLSAEKRGGNFSFPVDELEFQSLGTGAGQILHGRIRLKMTCSVGVVHMPESVAIFTMII